MKRYSLAVVHVVLAIGLLGAAYLAMPSAQSASAPRNRKRRVALPRRRRREHPLFAARPGDTGELRDAQGGVALQPAGRRRSDDRARHAELRRREAAERRRAAASRRVHRSDERQAALELRRAGDLPIEVLDARRLRQGRRVSRDQRPRRRLHLHAGLLPLRARRGDRQAARELGTAGAAPVVSAHRRRRSRRGSDSRLGAVDRS